MDRICCHGILNEDINMVNFMKNLADEFVSLPVMTKYTQIY